VKGYNELHPESTLNADIYKQWRLGNRGRIGEWYEEEDEKIENMLENAQSYLAATYHEIFEDCRHWEEVVEE